MLEASNGVALFQRLKSVFNLAAVCVFQMFLGVNNYYIPESSNEVAGYLALRTQWVFQSPGMIFCSELDPSSCRVGVQAVLLQASAFALANRANDRCSLAGLRGSHSWDNVLQHMLSPVSGSFFNKGLKRDQASGECCQHGFVKGKSCPINLISFPQAVIDQGG